MRTTLDIDDDVLLAVKENARRENKTAGAVISALARRALTTPPAAVHHAAREPEAFYGFVPLPKQADVLITNELINQLRDDEGV